VPRPVTLWVIFDLKTWLFLLLVILPNLIALSQVYVEGPKFGRTEVPPLYDGAWLTPKKHAPRCMGLRAEL